VILKVQLVALVLCAHVEWLKDLASDENFSPFYICLVFISPEVIFLAESSGLGFILTSSWLFSSPKQKVSIIIHCKAGEF
jgi:hypothetical protein